MTLYSSSSSLAKQSQQGFTLIEVLVAIGVFAFLAVVTNALLNTVINTSRFTNERSAEFEKLQRGMLVIERDFMQMQARVPRIQGANNELVITGGEFELESDAFGVGFVRGGWQNPQLRLRRSHLQNVAYRLQENKLERLHTNYVDTIIGEEPKVRVILEGVSDFRVEVANDLKSELEWSDTIAGSELPKAIAIIIDTENFGEIRRVFKVSA